ncbi:MAG TPA: M12 family metallopeptidase [Phycisphaerales bacterium]|nr:M12 family metallopeptidase [Phycisphaerales bacterium]
MHPKLLAFLLLTSVVATLASGQIAQLNPPPAHPLFPETVEEGGDPVIACSLDPFALRAHWGSDMTWPGGIVHYVFDANVVEINRQRARIAMNELETTCGVRFVPRTDQASYVHIRAGTSNSAFIGRGGLSQPLQLVSWSSRYIVCHELMHAMGVWHEHQRFDRDTYVTVMASNVQAGRWSNFLTHEAHYPIMFGNFDFESIMCYDDCTFSTCCPAGGSCACSLECAVLVAKPGYEAMQNVMGNRAYLSTGDRNGLIAHYGPPIDDGFEDNDTFATARALPITFPQTLRLIDEVDVFEPSVTSGTPITARFTGGVWSMDNVTLTILSPTGIVLQTALPTDPDGDGVYTAVVNSPTDNAAGTYRVSVSRSQRWGGDYTLTTSIACNDIDFNNNNVFPEDQDVMDFFNVLAGGDCSEPACDDIDFNNNGVFPEFYDILGLFNVLGGGTCP